MKALKYITIAAALLLPMTACDSFLEVTPQGIANSDDLNSVDNVEKMVIAAYSALGNDNYQDGMFSPWPYGDLRAGDAYKGGAGTGDMGDFHLFETFVYLRDDNSYLDKRWYAQYINIARCNDALKRINALSESDYAKKKMREAEVRFLRAHFYFEIKIMFKHIPWVDENDQSEDYINISNVEYTDQQLWEMIIEEFRYAVNNLPETQDEVGRANKNMAQAYLAKALLYAAYVQDDQHNVTSIDQNKLQEVVTLCQGLGNRYALADDFAENFLCETENGKESIFAIQHSVNDNTLRGRLDWGAMLNYPMNPDYGCCGFHCPSQNMVNAFQTDANGLPQFDTYNDNNIQTAEDLLTHNIDPRLNHTVAIPGAPYKYNPEFIFETSWTRDPSTYGSFMSMKETVLPDCPCFAFASPFMSSGKNRDIIRYDDVMLWQAEALIELGRHQEALPLINAIRERAARSTTRLVDVQGDPIGKYVVAAYEPGKNCPAWTQEFARKALRWERRLEMSQEGTRYFDLVRWGIAAETVNAYFAVEKTRRTYMGEAQCTKNRDEYFPIPKNQINFSKKLYQQNHGW
ncbi:MAG: RagB/SusD family nutrient uptake outer membrane protein [bacterium]|nr:RagB/SusD family nutrient uptake outer membrane protein [Parabacteroides sp.]MDD6099131.1 RagB/SusD family nutrient uptake outer membrane protein [bacterium]MDD6767228.1 RagB/SusD family nutrient uptake outer membrane protein [bacterium]MDD6836881.1 RagB/SusD family nutrient uptake outer membrane protein [bacterium]MDD7723818.1 RagB/SusD family nutrient uptake outer membrane protein [bacterium]